MSQVRPLPNNLSHYPLRFIEYHDHDGIYAENTDAQYLSLGISTWSQMDLSLKVWRKGGKNNVWLRQSEELPIHRPIDMVILLLAEMAGDVQLPPHTLENQATPITIERNQPIPHSVPSLEHYFNHKNAEDIKGDSGSKKGDVIKNRLRILKKRLDKLEKLGVL